MLSMNVTVHDIVQPFYFIGLPTGSKAQPNPMIQFTTIDTVVTVITGFSLKALVDVNLECGGAPAPDVTFRSDIQIDGTSIFTSLKGLQFGYPLNQLPEYEKKSEFIPVRPNAEVKFGFWGTIAGVYQPVFKDDCICEIWGYITRINYQNSLVQK